MSKLLWQVVVNGLAGALFGAGLLGLFGFLLAGWPGMLNGIAFGGVFGVLFGITAVGLVTGTYWWSGILGRFGAWWARKELSEK
jgi:hypothetical protein